MRIRALVWQRVRAAGGFTGLMIAGIVIPLVMVIFAVGLDLAREPLAEYGLRKVLVQASFSAEKAAFDNPDYRANLLDPGLPAGNGLVSKIVRAPTVGAGSADMAPITEHGYINAQNAESIAHAACDIAEQEMNSSSSAMFMATGVQSEPKYAFEFTVVRGYKDSNMPDMVATFRCASSGFALGDFNWEDVAEGMRKSFQTVEGESDTPAGPGAWYIEARGAPYGAITPNPVEADDVIPSAWLIGVGLVEVSHFMGSLLRSEEKRNITDYFVRPFNAPLAIEAGAPYHVKKPPLQAPILATAMPTSLAGP